MKTKLFAITSILALLFANCSSNVAYKASQPYQENVLKTTQNERKIIYNAYLKITVKQVDSANAFISKLALNYEGYIVTVGSNSTEIRVKSTNLNNALTELNNIGKVTHKKVYGQDITEEFFDFEIRLENAKKARERYLELLQKAENVTTTLLVEKELERLNGEIDSLQGKLNRMKHLTEYSTININLEQKEKLGILGYVFVGLYKGISWLFVR